MKLALAQPRYVLPLMMFLGVLMVGLRVGDLWLAATTGPAFAPVTVAQAETAKEAPKEEHAKDVPAAKPEPASEATAKKEAPPADEETSSAEMELVKQLSDRRDQLDKRAKSLDTREALIRVAEQRVDQKIREMETLRTQLQAMVSQASAAQQAQLDNLVKIYETMKPKEAAKIFETLEMPVLLGVVQKMKPQRTAAVMAEMNPEKAKEITVALTKQDQLPQVK